MLYGGIGDRLDVAGGAWRCEREQERLGEYQENVSFYGKSVDAECREDRDELGHQFRQGVSIEFFHPPPAARFEVQRHGSVGQYHATGLDAWIEQPDLERPVAHR